MCETERTFLKMLLLSISLTIILNQIESERHILRSLIHRAEGLCCSALHFPVKRCVSQHLCGQLNMCLCVLPGGCVDSRNMLLVRSCELSTQAAFIVLLRKITACLQPGLTSWSIWPKVEHQPRFAGCFLSSPETDSGGLGENSNAI